MAGFRVAHHITPDPTPKRRPAKSKDYLAFLHTLPCTVTGRHEVQAAHVSFASLPYGAYGRGKSHKVNDRWALPLCEEEHRRQHNMNERDYWDSVGINPHLLCLILWGLYSDMGDDAQPFAAAIIHQWRTTPSVIARNYP